jgi:organic radical activating enzyme
MIYVMKLSFFRQGHANNSSSDHSIIFTKEKLRGKSSYSDGSYGHEEFILNNPEKKAKYILVQLYHSVHRLFPNLPLLKDEDMVQIVLLSMSDSSERSFAEEKSSLVLFFNALFETKRLRVPPSVEEWMISQIQSAESYFEFGVDHQSIWSLPRDYNTDTISMDFFIDLANYLIHTPEIIILGGSDNSDSMKERLLNTDDSMVTEFISSIRESSGDMVCKYDHGSGEWTVRKSRGYSDIYSIYRFSFDPNHTPAKKASFPGLVDIKITGFCNFGCNFCYQESTTLGEHCSFEDYRNLLTTLKAAGVMEVVLGGGEPTKHPQFMDMIDLALGMNFSVGFTTKNFDLDKELDHERMKTWENRVTVAVSVANAAETKKVQQLKSRLSEDRIFIDFYMQIILEMFTREKLEKFLAQQKENWSFEVLTLLGLKQFGFAKEYSVKEPKGWIELIKKFSDGDGDEYDRTRSISVDALIVKRYKQQLLDAGVKYYMLTGDEGSHSCYVDLVAKTMSASSYTDTTYPYVDEKFLEIFSKV